MVGLPYIIVLLTCIERLPIPRILINNIVLELFRHMSYNCTFRQMLRRSYRLSCDARGLWLSCVVYLLITEAHRT